jgi:hypothetical protein
MSFVLVEDAGIDVVTQFGMVKSQVNKAKSII